MTARRGIFPILLVVLCGCERGCLRGWLTRVVASKEPGGSGSSLVQEVDCPDGLARCVEGVIEVSKAARRPATCPGNPEGCSCPWESTARCEARCAADGVELITPREGAARRLCAPAEGSPPFASPSPPATPPPAGTACGEERYRCVSGIVLACSAVPARAAATCLRGCAADGQELDDEELDDRAAMALLCER